MCSNQFVQVPLSVKVAALLYLLVPTHLNASDLSIGNWNWLITTSSGSASVSANITNSTSGGNSGSIGLYLQLSTQPYGDARTYYTIASETGLAQLSGGYQRSYSISDSFSNSSIPNGTYYIVLVVAEYSGGSYVTRDGATASDRWIVGGASDLDDDFDDDSLTVPFYPTTCGFFAVGNAAIMPIGLGSFLAMSKSRRRRRVNQFAGRVRIWRPRPRTMISTLLFFCGAASIGMNCIPGFGPPTPTPLPLDNPPAGAESACAPIEFTGSNMIGLNSQKIMIDPLFYPHLTRLNEYAKSTNVRLLIIDSFRETNAGLTGAIVTPSDRTNHMVGHAIDMNVQYGPNFSKTCNSACLRPSNVPANSTNEEIVTYVIDEVRPFLELLIADPAFKWGADFKVPKPDPVHIDDRLNLSNPSKWETRFDAMRGLSANCQQSDGCRTGYTPAINDADICCPNGYPYYWLSDDSCHIQSPQVSNGCNPGAAPAINHPAVCCPEGYPYYWADDYCHTQSPQQAAGGCPPPGSWIACTCPNKHYCVSVNCGGTYYHVDGLTCSEFSCD